MIGDQFLDPFLVTFLAKKITVFHENDEKCKKPKIVKKPTFCCSKDVPKVTPKPTPLRGDSSAKRVSVFGPVLDHFLDPFFALFFINCIFSKSRKSAKKKIFFFTKIEKTILRKTVGFPIHTVFKK